MGWCRSGFRIFNPSGQVPLVTEEIFVGNAIFDPSGRIRLGIEKFFVGNFAIFDPSGQVSLEIDGDGPVVFFRVLYVALVPANVNTLAMLARALTEL